MKALIEPTQQISQITSWQLVDNIYEPVYTILGERIAQVSETEFEVAPPLFWVDCADDVQDWWYYDTLDATCKETPPPAPQPEPVMPEQPSGTIESL